MSERDSEASTGREIRDAPTDREIRDAWADRRIRELEEELAALRAERDVLAVDAARWERLVLESPVGIAVYHPDGRLKTGNARMRQLFGVSEAAYEGLVDSYNLLEDEQHVRSGVVVFFRRAFAGESVTLPPIRYESAPRGDGERRGVWVQASLRPVHDAEGNVHEVILVLVDITDVEEARAQVDRQREIFRTQLSEVELLYDSSPVGLCQLNADLRFVRLNDMMARTVGHPKEEHLGRTLRRLVPNLAAKIEPLCERVIETGEPSLQNEIVGTTAAAPDVERTWLTSYYPLFAADGRVTGVSTVLQDITELKRQEQALRESEENFQELAGNIRDAFWLFDWKRQEVIYVSPVYEEIWGRPASALYADYGEWEASIHSDDRHTARLAFDESGGGGHGWRREYRIVRPDGEIRWIADRAAPIRDDVGEVVRVAGIAEDVTEYKKAEEERQLFEAKIRQAQKLESLGVLAGGIAHDFNNLLMGILGHADLARRVMPPESPGRPHLKQVETAALRAAELTNQMLAYSGRGRFVVEQLDINRLVQEMGHLLETVVSKKTTFRRQLATDLPLLEADAAQVRQIVMNLLTNASEALQDEPGTVTMRTYVRDVEAGETPQGFFEAEPAPGCYVALEVTDTGMGMNEATRERIFDPFFTTKFQGRGLGLAAVLGIVRGHKGAIRVESRPGRGTTFEVLFPASDVVATAEPAAPEVGPPANGTATVLVVDDDDMVRLVAQSMLEENGFDVLLAEDGQEAVDVFRANADEVACVLLDMTMPRLSGPEACAQIREIRSDVPVVLSSGYSQQDATSRFPGLGVDGFIQKPYRAADLIAELRRVLRRVLRR